MEERTYEESKNNSKNNFYKYPIRNSENITKENINFEDNCIEAVLKSYENLYKDPDERNKIKEKLIIPFFHQELIDENNVKDFSLDENINYIKNYSILFRKNHLNEVAIKLEHFFGEDNKNYFSFSSFIIKIFLNKNNEDESQDSQYSNPFKYQNFWVNGLKIIIFELIGILFFLRLFTIINYFSYNSDGEEINKNLEILNSNLNSSNLDKLSSNFNFTGNKDDKSWNNFISNEYRCLSFDISDLLDENYSFNITCQEGKQFFYISKFGVSPFNEESENIAECYSSSFKNLIKVDSECDLSNYLDEQLKEYKYKEANIEIKIKEMNISNSILNKCNNKYQRKKFFLSYSCYIPNVKYFKKDFKRGKIILIYLIFELFFLGIMYNDFLVFRRIFFEKLNNNPDKNIKNLTLMIDSISIEKDKIISYLSKVLLQIKNILFQAGSLQNQQYYQCIREINYSFLNSEEKELYEEFNSLLQKRNYLESIIRNGGGNRNLKRSVIKDLLCCCCQNTYKEEFKENEKELKKVFKKILQKEKNTEKIKKIYITFSSYKDKKNLKNRKIQIDGEFYILKKADLYPNDINWENINKNKPIKIIRRIISYFLLIIFMFIVFLGNLIISRIQNSFERKYNLSTDCTNIASENIDSEIYYEFIDKNKTEKEKIYTYCYCKSDFNGNKLFYNNLEFDPCQDYNENNYKRKLNVQVLSAIISIIDVFVDPIVDKIISIQIFESKSYKNNLKIVISIIILLFSNIISVILINARFNSNKIITFFIFGKYEDITPEWVKSIPNNILYSLAYSAGFFFIKTVFNIILQICIKIQFLWKNPINNNYDFIKIYSPEIDYSEYTAYVIYFFLTISILQMNIYIFICVFLIIILYSILYFSKCFVRSYSVFLNKQYFKIFFAFIILVFIFFVLGDFWWYSSEYYFIDINENVYNNFFGSNKELIDKFIKGNAGILEKIKAKFLLKRNICLYIQILMIIILEFCNSFFCQPKKDNDSNNNSLNMNDYIAIKFYEIYRLLYYKLGKKKFLSKIPDNEYYNFIEFKYYENIFHFFPGAKESNILHQSMLGIKNDLIRKNEIQFINPDYSYSPMLLDDYCISSISKLVLSPNY